MRGGGHLKEGLGDFFGDGEEGKLTNAAMGAGEYKFLDVSSDVFSFLRVTS